jgi:hypothetical protein
VQEIQRVQNPNGDLAGNRGGDDCRLKGKGHRDVRKAAAPLRNILSNDFELPALEKVLCEAR